MHGVPKETLLACWYRAQEHELGCVIQLADPKDLKRASTYLYKARDEHADPSLNELMLCLPEGGTEIFIVKKAVELREELSNGSS